MYLKKSENKPRIQEWRSASYAIIIFFPPFQHKYQQKILKTRETTWQNTSKTTSHKDITELNKGLDR